MKITSLKVVSDADSGWLHRRFGDHVAQISVETKMKMRLAVRDVSRQQRGFVTSEIETLAKKFPQPPQGVEDLDFVLGYDNDEGHQQGAIEVDEAIQEYVRLYPKDWEIVQQCLGLARQRSRHACAYVIGNEPIEQMIPLTTVGGVRVTAYNAPAVEAVGGLKMDFLVVNSLMDIGDCIKLVQKRHREVEYKEAALSGLRVPRFRQIPIPGGGLADIWNLPDDQNVFTDVSQGRTETVFQFNTESARKWLKHFNYRKANGNYAIDSIATMAYFTALDRPGPLDAYVSNPEEEDTKHNMLVEYARRVRGAPKSPDILPIFDELLPHMNGIMITQEALQYMYQRLTGCSGPEAEDFRSNIAKKKMAKVEKAYLPFIESATKTIGKENAEAVWKNFITFGQYGFNQSIDGDTIISTCDGTMRRLRDYNAGDSVNAVDDRGNAISTAVMALHDHGMLEGFEATFDDGYSLIISSDHKFLTAQGQKPLYEIVARGMEVLSSGRQAYGWMDGTLRGGVPNETVIAVSPESMHGLHEPPGYGPQARPSRIPGEVRDEGQESDGRKNPSEHLRTVLGDVVAPAKQRWLGSSLRADLSWKEGSCGTSPDVLSVRGGEERKHQSQAGEVGGKPRVPRNVFGNGQENFHAEGHSASARGEAEGLERRQSGEVSRDSQKTDPLPKELEGGGMASTGGDPNVARCSNCLWDGAEAGGFCKPGSQSVGGDGRRIPLLPSDEGEEGDACRTPGVRPGAGRDAQNGSVAPVRCDIDPNILRVFQGKLEEKTERRVARDTYANAPLSSTGDLVLRRIVQVRSVGPRRMYDLEVSHPKHNFVLPNGVVTSNSHAVCYSVIGYACAYLKHHYPLEWWTSVLSNASKNEVSDKFWKHCGQLIRLPDVTKSGAKFTISGEHIQAPLNIIKGVGDGADKQLSKYAPYTDILDFCRKIEKHRMDGGGYVMKTVKYKDKDNKVLNPETGRMVATDAIKEERTFKRGPNTLNAGVIKVLIASGAMDGLFSENVLLEEQMTEYEKAMAAAETETNIATAPAGKTVRPIKPKKVDPSEFNLNALQRYQSRKAVLPIYGADLIPMVVRSGKANGLKQYPGRALMEWISPFNGKESIVELIGADALSHDEDFIVKDKKSVNVAVAAYIEEVEIRKYGPLLKEMVKVKLDVEGARFEFVKFSGKTGVVADCFRQPLQGAVAVVILNKWTNDRPFGPEDVLVVEPPINVKTPDPDPAPADVEQALDNRQPSDEVDWTGRSL